MAGTTFQREFGGASSGGSGTDATARAAAAAAQATANAAAVKANNGSDFANLGTLRSNIGLAIGTNVQAWDTDLDALAALAATAGMVSRTGAGAFAVRTIAGTASRLTVTNGDGAAGAPTLDIHTSYVGQSSITTLGTITTGVWNGTAVPLANGGTGQATAALARNAIDKGATALTDGATINTDCSVNNFFTLTLTAGGHTLANPTNMAAGASYSWAISPATFAMSFGAAFDFGAKGTPTLTTTAGKTDYITGYSPDGTKLHVSFNPGFS